MFCMIYFSQSLKLSILYNVFIEQKRVEGARMVLDKLLSDKKIGELVRQMLSISLAYISLANIFMPKINGEFRSLSTESYKNYCNY